MAAHEMNQADWRRDRNIRDQWGRLWLVAFETGPGGVGGSQMPTGQISEAGWSDPLKTPQEYLTIPKGEFGEPDRNKLAIIYGPWLKKIQDAERDWKKRLIEIGRKMYKTAFNLKTAEEDEVLMSEAGPKPWPPSQAIVRASKGDKAMLGLATLAKADRELLGLETLEDLGYDAAPSMAEPNPQLPPIPVSEKPMRFFTFVAELKKRGITDAKEVKGLWKAYREAEAEA